ncbi:glycerophosphodiester phosphodiesterase [Arenibacter latericius]|uniref:glycerophosphodiester phosphodiesterase n=1 Tax=Arenibacter latericius TaxID=86104 RepID=UPI000402BF71|nr:glycerophosphodiester phosphodiesterase family protein [Arenibacter latericius]MDX1363258.1 glycerophosphodiester phosphodiesterase family protein [Arenibacter latericius]
MKSLKTFGFFFVVLLILSCENMNTPLVIGHRGAMGHETENTLASIQKALDLEVDMIEIDVFKIRSGEIVVFHDGNVEKLTDGTGKIEGYNYNELQELTLEGNHKIPTLQEVINLIDKKAHLNIELKGANTADRVNFIINYYVKEKGWPLDKFLISSFKWEELKRMRALNPQIGIAILTDKDPLQAISIAEDLKAIAINPYYKTLTLENVDKIQKAGFKVYPYTINEKEDIKSMKQMGVDGIITNYPERIK